MEWFFTQLVGLASAIENLHHPKQNPQESCRHGDLKPENILCFSKHEPGARKIPTDVKLVIADAGHAKVHEKATELRGEQTKTPRGTRMYAPPEAEINPTEARSRRYDIWSLGCMYLEFLVWILYGNETLESFRGVVGYGEPYYTRVQEVTVKNVVKDWIRLIKEDPRCAPAEMTAIGRLVDLIENRLLVVKVEARRDSNSGEKNDAGSPIYSSTPLTSEVRFQAIVKRPTFDLTDESAERADATEMREEMEKIFKASKKGDSLTWINKNGMTEAAKRGPPRINSTLGPIDQNSSSRARKNNEPMIGVSLPTNMFSHRRRSTLTL